MGDIKRKRKLFSRPKKLFDRVRMDAEDILVKRYGLKNKREIWKAKSTVSRFRRRAKQLIGADGGEQRIFFEKLNKMGIAVVDISDVLALTEENLLDRRLETILFKKGLANTPKQARQLIVHKNVLVDGKVVNTPSFIVTKDLETSLTIKVKKKKEQVDSEKTVEANDKEGSEKVKRIEEKVNEKTVEEMQNG
jgi:small subunit ribosomal protein S4